MNTELAGMKTIFGEEPEIDDVELINFTAYINKHPIAAFKILDAKLRVQKMCLIIGAVNQSIDKGRPISIAGVERAEILTEIVVAP